MKKTYCVEIKTTLTRVIELESRDAACAMADVQEILDLRPRTSTDPMIGEVKCCESWVAQVRRK